MTEVLFAALAGIRTIGVILSRVIMPLCRVELRSLLDYERRSRETLPRYRAAALGMWLFPGTRRVPLTGRLEDA